MAGAKAFLNNLIRKNPTRGFPRAVVTELSYDFRTGTLCGVRLQSPLDDLVPFGAANAAGWLTDDYVRLDYHPLGLRIEVFEQVVEEFSLLFEPVLDRLPAFQQATCVLHFPGGTSLRVSRTTTSTQIQQQLGPPDDTTLLVGRATLEYSCVGSTHALFEFEPNTSTLIRAAFAPGIAQPARAPIPTSASESATGSTNGDGSAPSPSAARRLGVLTAAYLAILTLAAAFGARSPERAWDASVLGSVIASFPLGFFGLGGNAIFEERMASRWWFLLPKLEFVPFMFCFVFGLGLVEVLRWIFESVFGA